MGEREKLLSKLERFLIIRNRISNGLAGTVIEELIKETEERLAQIENNLSDLPWRSEPLRSFSLCPSCLSRGSGFGVGATCSNSLFSPFARRGKQSGRPEASRFRSSAMPIALSGPARRGATRPPCAPSCGQVCIAELWRGSRSGAMRPPGPLGWFLVALHPLRARKGCNATPAASPGPGRAWPGTAGRQVLTLPFQRAAQRGREHC